MKIKCTVPSRIAITLYDMNGELGRVDGGVGFSLDAPCLAFEIYVSNDMEICRGGISDEMNGAIIEAVQKIKDKYNTGNAAISIIKNIPEHRGFGSKTATLLSIGKAYGRLYGLDLDYRELGVFLGRGGTSGLGINLIDKGGFMLEGGHSRKYKKDFLPSSATTKPTAAPVFFRHDMPDWQILILTPAFDRSFGQKEVEVFQTLCPVPADDVEKISRIILSQILPSLVENDLGTFCTGISSIQNLGFKKGEIERYGGKIGDIMQYLKGVGAKGIGMSSMGPTLYAFGDNLSKIAEHMKSKSTFRDIILHCLTTKVNNRGIHIEAV